MPPTQVNLRTRYGAISRENCSARARASNSAAASADFSYVSWSWGNTCVEVRAKQYWRLDHLRSFDEFLEKRFADSRRKAYYLMAIHEKLTRIPKHELHQVGWSKATELVKVARKDGERFDCATWLHKAKELPKEGFKNAVEQHLTGKETEPWEILYFKVYKSQLAVVEKALETTALMLGGDKSRGYCLEMICADFLAGANLTDSEP